jgi:hypothetical protein
MHLTSDVPAAAVGDQPRRRCCGDRRIAGERRRSPRGWFEMRASRDGIEVDRRRDRRDGLWRRIHWAFARRSGGV